MNLCLSLMVDSRLLIQNLRQVLWNKKWSQKTHPYPIIDELNFHVKLKSKLNHRWTNWETYVEFETVIRWTNTFTFISITFSNFDYFFIIYSITFSNSAAQVSHVPVDCIRNTNKSWTRLEYVYTGNFDWLHLIDFISSQNSWDYWR